MRKPKEKIKLETKKVNFGQFGEAEDDSVTGEFESIDDKYLEYSNAIGSFIISFSDMEDSVDTDLATAINERAHEPGYRIIKYLNFRNKINLLRDDYVAFIKYLTSESDKKRLLNEIKIIHDKLCELSEFRNKVAHANWNTLDTSGFVRTKILENKEDPGMQFLKVKMTPLILLKFRRQNDAISNRICVYREKVWEAYRKEQSQIQKKMSKK
jgi:hypothetical protein